MTLELLYWILMLLWILGGAWWSFRPDGNRDYFAWSLLPFLLFVIIGLKLFGSPLKG